MTVVLLAEDSVAVLVVALLVAVVAVGLKHADGKTRKRKKVTQYCIYGF
jgi:hypothetical protein